VSDGEEKPFSLTPREREVLTLMAQGMSNGEIASALFISEHTVKNHVSNIYRKLGDNDRTRGSAPRPRTGPGGEGVIE